jgi:hypothetical protein
MTFKILDEIELKLKCMKFENLNDDESKYQIIGCLIECGRNATYKAKDFAYRLIESALSNQSLEAEYHLTKYLSADRVLQKLHKIKYEQIQNLITKVNKNLKLPKNVILAIDFTENVFSLDKKR